MLPSSESLLTVIRLEFTIELDRKRAGDSQHNKMQCSTGEFSLTPEF